ncbi:protein CHUP1, chloroplastic isoform X2 [Cornus florida]|nr:protein CHUP1, chloroplastic isoform X2 [Cornus florida]
MKQETTATRSKGEGKPSSVSFSTTTTTTTTNPSRFRVSSKAAKDSPKPDTMNGESPSSKSRAKSVPQKPRRSLVLSKPKSGDDVAVVGMGSQSHKGRDLEDVKGVVRTGNRPVAVEQYARPRRQRPPMDASSKRNEDDLDGKKKKELLQEKIVPNDIVIKNLQSEVMELKAELEKMQSLNMELQSQNRKLSDNLVAAEAKIAALTLREQRVSISEYQSPKFKDIQKLIANKLEHQKTIKESNNEASKGMIISPSPATPPSSSVAQVQGKVPDCPSAPPPPPPLPPRRSARAAIPPKAPAIVEFYHSLAKRDVKKNPTVQASYSKSGVSSAHNSIVGEIQNRSAHLLAIKSDIETKGEFINGLIQKVLAAAYTDIEDVLKFMDWLDNELSSLADERAVLKHFNWPERKADTMREAAIEYRALKILESEVSSYKDDAGIPCGIALKKMAGLLDKSERSIQRLVKLRHSVVLSYQGYKIPIDWMLDSGIISKIKKASMMLAKMYMKRVTLEVESIRYSERESTQEALLLQGVHFVYRAHQFAGGLDSETLCALEEIRQRVPGHLRGSQELFVGIPTS